MHVAMCIVIIVNSIFDSRPKYLCEVNYFDIIIAIPLIWFGYKGFSKGAIIEITSVLAFVLGIWGGIHFSDFISQFLIEYVSDKYMPIVSFSIIFIAIVIGVFILGIFLEKIINIVKLKLVNKILGAAFGALKILIMMSFLVIILDRYDRQFKFLPQDMKKESALYEPLCDFSKLVVPAVEESESFKEHSQVLDFDLKLPDFMQKD
jgi:membrane protein required for colicin V production